MIVDVALYVDGVRTEGPSDISDLVDLARIASEREPLVRVMRFPDTISVDTALKFTGSDENSPELL